MRFYVATGFLIDHIKLAPNMSRPAGPEWVVIDEDFPEIADKNQWVTYNWDVTSVLDTLAKADDAGIYIYHGSATGDGIYVDHCYLIITTNKGSYTLDIDAVDTLTGWRTYGSSPYLDAEDYPTNYLLNCTIFCTGLFIGTFENTS